MVKERKGFQKVYDLTERVLSEQVSTTLPSDDEWARYHTVIMLRALGIGTARDIAYAKTTIRRLTSNSFKPDYAQAIHDLLEEGIVQNCHVKGEDYLVLAESLTSIPTKVGRDRVKFLSPFDNLVINRSRTRRLFNFDYLIECYVPEAKRRYGYFTLPLLWGDELIGRMDSKANRKNRQLIIKNLFLEPGIAPTESLSRALLKGIKQFQFDQDCDHTVVQACSSPQLLKRLKEKVPAFHR